MSAPLALPTLVGTSVRLRAFSPADLPVVREASTDTLRTLAPWALTVPGVSRLELYVEPWNVASARTAAGAGFVREGMLRSWQTVGDERRDMEMYALVARPQ